MFSRRPRASDDLHDDSVLMIPPSGFKFIPKSDVVCGKPGCFECFDIYCERCESKDRRIVELEMRNNDLIKYVTQLQGRLFGTRNPGGGGGGIGGASVAQAGGGGRGMGIGRGGGGGGIGGPTTSDPFAYIQSPVLYDPNMNVSYVATTTFSPAPHDAIGMGGTTAPAVGRGEGGVVGVPTRT